MMGPSERTRVTSYLHDGHQFDVVDSGPIDGEVIVLLHGFPQRASSWAKVMETLNTAGFRTLAPDQRGYSPGARPRGRRAYRIAKLVGDVAALIRHIDAGPVHVVGHDWGAGVGWGLTARHPSLVRSWTSISVPHPSAFLRSMLSSSQALSSWYMAFFQLPLVPELLLTRFPKGRDRALGRYGMDRELLDRVAEEIVRDGALYGGLGYYRAMPFLGRTPKVRVPTTHVWSDGDTALGRRGARLTARYVRAPYELVIMEGVTHWVPDHEPEALAAIIMARARSVGNHRATPAQ
jgi:pimeloyl-ACP methyl ester carboxylesterase